MFICRGVAPTRVEGDGSRTDETEPMGDRPRASARGLAIRRQSVLYGILLGVGSVLIYLRDLPLVTEGVAFMAIGAVGLIMSWTTQDVSQGIRGAIREDGDRTRARLDSVVEAVDRVGASVDAAAKRQDAAAKESRDFFKQMLDRQDAAAKRQDAAAKRQDAAAKESRDFFKQMLDRRDAAAKADRDLFKRVLEKQDAMLESQKSKLERVS